MNNTGQSIVERENLPKNLERLAAQKELYFRAKRLFTLQLFLTVVITLCLTVASLVFNIPDWVRGFYGVVVTILDLLLLNRFINKFRQKAASIQELFDCHVLGLERNSVLVSEEPISSLFFKLSDIWHSSY